MRTAASAPRIAFSWNGLPQYAARLVRAAIDRLDEPCVVVGSRPSVPVEGMERVLAQKVHWVDADRAMTWSDLGLSVPEIFIQSGWSYPAFSSLGREVRKKRGYVIGLSDANWRGDMRQLLLGPIGFRAIHRAKFDAMVVPGRQGAKLLTYFGMAPERIHHGMYGADPEIFTGGPPLAARPKTFQYVGQFIERKGVLTLGRAFLRFSAIHPGWTLQLTGSGELRDKLPSDARIKVESFVQPEELATRYHAARFFILPSRVEAWGLVVHEAALCGCALALSDAIGSADDLVTEANGVRFRAGDEDALVRALVTAASRDEAWLACAQAQSRALAANFGPDRFAREIAHLVRERRSGDGLIN